MATHEKAALAGPARPLGVPEIPQFFLPVTVQTGVYTPRLYGAAHIHFGGARRKFNESRQVAFLLPLDNVGRIVDWDAAVPTGVMPDHLLHEAPRPGSYLPLPAGAMELKTFTRWAKSFDRWLARTQRLVVTPKADGAEEVSVGPKRGGVSVDLVGIAWELA
ncbi:MAG: hypothetical protein IT184_11660 [Acidobacteria bacterium]|nr:hypothetical protein [Acidobacteriota bacterium]